MAVEEGLVKLIQNGLAGSPPVAAVAGGFPDELPKDVVSSAVPMAWCYRTIILDPEYVINGQTGWMDWEVQIDCHGFAAADALRLKQAVQRILRGGYTGVLPDADRTFVFQLIQNGPALSGFSDASRTWVRSLNYTVSYQQI